MTNLIDDNLAPSAQDAFTTEVILGLKQGDRLAWGKLYDAYSESLWKYVSRLIGHDVDAITEVVQESFLAAARSARTYDASRGSIWAWLTGIAHRQSSNWFRKQKRCHKVTDGEVQRKILSGTSSDAQPLVPFQILEKQEQVATVRKALGELSAEYAFLLTAKYMEQLTVEQIQLHVGGTSDSIRSKLRRARAEFRSIFERLNDGGPEE